MRNVVILGMHRSGTSMVAGALAAAGVHVGDTAELLADQEDNPRGFCERRDVVELNDRCLAACHGSWFQPPHDIEGARALAGADVQTIMGRMPIDRSWLIKDPRMAITWPLWDNALTNAVRPYVYRDPFAVATSLQRRNGFPLSLGLALWEYYNQSALDAMEGHDAVSLSFSAISADPTPAVNTLLDQLADLGVNCTRPLEGDVFDPSLDRSGERESATLDALLSPSQRQLAAYCQALCGGATPPERPAMDETLWPRLQDISSALAPLARVRETQFELDDALSLCDERTEERDESLRQLRALEDDQYALSEAHKQEVSSHEETRQQRDQLHQKYNMTLAENATIKERAESLFIELSTTYGRLLTFEQSLLASVWRFIGGCYKLVRFRRLRNNSYDDVLEAARGHFARHDIDMPDAGAERRKTAGKASMLGDVLSYVARNPAGSVRSFSLPRLKRAAAVFMTSTPEDLGVWIDSRFPERGSHSTADSLAELDESLDELRLIFPLAESPRVSIVVPVYNEYRVTMRCLQSVLEHSAAGSYEVIIGDDCSTDLTASIGERVENVHIVRGEQNRGFLGNCNEAAGHARGEHILFLNNDTAVCAHWLDSLLTIVDGDESVGIVGSKLLFPNGKLQEAGGIMWRDGSAWNFGRMDDPDKPEYSYVKEVDYISGACMMIRAGLWRELGGFDVRYLPAYYEDADLAFEVRAAGYKVVLQPLSRVFHFEGLSNGTDLGSGIKQYQVDNQVKFREKWQCELDEFHFPNAENVFQARDRSRNQRCVLFIDHYVPHYDKDAGSRSTFMYVKLMLELGYRVLFLGANFFPHKPYTETLQQLGVEVLVGESMARNQDRWLRDNAPYIDCIYLHRPHVAEQFLSSLEKMQPRPKIIFFGHDLHYLRINREYQLLGDDQLRRSADKWRKREYAVFDRVDTIYYPSDVEVEEIRTQSPDLDLRAIPLYAFEEREMPDYDFATASDILFVGGFNHPPNVDGICWFVEEVLPIISRGCPGIQLHVVGSNPTDTVQALQSEQVLVYGYLSDEELEALYRRVRLVIVPLRFGAGVKGKVLEAIQKNLPLVTTSVGAEGIPDAASVMTIADTAEDFADSVVSLHQGNEQMLARMVAYPNWLRRNFSKSNATGIVLEDFGPPSRTSVEHTTGAEHSAGQGV